jgi:hypothetical protein
MMRLAGQAQHRRSRLNSNVRPQKAMPPDLRIALIESHLLASQAAAAALARGWTTHQVSEPTLATDMAAKTYALRAAHVRAKPGAHWQQLAASTEEFTKNLRDAIGAEVECLTISGPEAYEYVVFCLVEPPKVIGCMLVRPNEDTTPHGHGETAA